MISLVVLFLCVVLLVIALPVKSRFSGSHGLVDGRLRACQYVTNCVCSEEYAAANIEAITIDGQHAGQYWAALTRAINETGGAIKEDSGHYLWATYQTPIMRFVDDFEARLDRQNNKIHIRSASRVGRSDLGANRRRVEEILAAMNVPVD